MLSRLFKRQRAIDLTDLWHRIVAIAREPHWYASDGVADTVEGRFDMISAVMALVMIRFEDEGAAQHAARLTELFIDDMDGQLREAGVGDLVVGKRMGKLMAALGGRIGAYREGLSHADDDALAQAARRNTTMIDPDDDGTRMAAGLRRLMADIRAVEMEDLLKGNIAR
ncbi:ubiquinol-cytochrome C chaperone family protein [uncultured Croceicoccus sp.]|uniref:ubiquinol-cytochrome C chaperone family protein n=1 Tax=uncultured Croceicoccus sp. TaxID=1295329 RepID=UPI00261A4E8C|nr:ubiquinol-cytochrome C chaperone family protein [uncultured Croceicoccus sp.]